MLGYCLGGNPLLDFGRDPGGGLVVGGGVGLGPAMATVDILTGGRLCDSGGDWDFRELVPNYVGGHDLWGLESRFRSRDAIIARAFSRGV